MIKKALVGTAILASLGTLVFGSDVISYAKTWGSSMRDAVKSEVPIEFEVQRAREIIVNLEPDITKCMELIAEQQVDIEDLTQEIALKQKGVSSQKGAILTLRSDLASVETRFVYDGHTYTTEDVKRDLATRFERFKVAEDTLQREGQILRAREKALSANLEKLENMVAEKQNLEVQIEQLEARMKSVQAAATVSTLEIDNSQLTRAKKLIRQLNKRLDVKEKLLDSEGKFTGLIPVEAKQQEVPADIANQVDTYFGHNNQEVKVVNLDEI